MKTKEQLIAENEAALVEQLAALERENNIRRQLPEAFRESARVCLLRDHAHVTMWNDFRCQEKLADAIAILEQYRDKFIVSEHWRSGCLECRPATINKYSQEASAFLDGTSTIEILVSGGKGYGPDVKIEFWAQLDGELVSIALPMCNLRKLVPHVKTTYNNGGEIVQNRVDWPVESRCVDSFRKWWSPPGSYRGSYYFADWENFKSWVSNQKV